MNATWLTEDGCCDQPYKDPEPAACATMTSNEPVAAPSANLSASATSSSSSRYLRPREETVIS